MLKVTQAQPTPGNTKWFQNDRFGLFIHWGTYALAARHEWVKHNEAIPDEIYDKYFKHLPLCIGRLFYFA